MSATAAPPYVGLLDKLRDLGKTIQDEGGHLISQTEITAVLTALVHFVEHGDELLRNAAFGYNAGIEPILTPDRPEGWAPPVRVEDPMQQELARLRGELDALRAGKPDPRQAYADEMRAQIQAEKANAQPTGAPADWPTDPRTDHPAQNDTQGEIPAFVQELQRRQQEAAAASANRNPDGGVEITTAEGDTVQTDTTATVEPTRDAVNETGGDTP